jgi:hypothetical protein
VKMKIRAQNHLRTTIVKIRLASWMFKRNFHPPPLCNTTSKMFVM